MGQSSCARSPRLAFVRPIADVEHLVLRARAAGGLEALARPPCRVTSCRARRRSAPRARPRSAAARDDDVGRLVGQRVEARVLDRVVLAAVALDAALPEEPDHRDGLLQHLEPLVPRRPAVAEDVLVQVLAGADAEEEAARHHRRRGRRRLGDDRRVDADRRAGDAGAEPQPLGRVGDAPITVQTNGLWPCASTHGWKWSEISANSNPASSASHAKRTRSFGG